MSISYAGNKASNTGAAVASLNVTFNGTVANTLLVVGTAAATATTAPTSIAVSDGTNGTYTLAGTLTSSSDLAVTLHYVARGAGGNVTVTSNPAGGTGDSQDMFVVCAEFFGGATSPISGTPAGATGTGTTATSGNTTPATNDCLIVAMMGTDAAAGAITENAGSQGYTLLAENENSSESGSMVYKILSLGSGAVQSESWTVPSELWAVEIAAFAPQTAIPEYYTRLIENMRFFH